MKSTALIAAICLILGFSIGWLSRPGPTELATIDGRPQTPAPGAQAIPSAKIAASPTVPSKSKRPTDDERAKEPSLTMSGASPVMQERFQKMIIEQARQKTSGKVAELAEKLGLSAEQTARLQAYFDDKIAALSTEDTEDGFPDMMALAKLQSNQSIDTAMAEILTDEQSTAYEELKTNERNRKIESRAYKDLARVNSVLDLDDDQKNAVYDILYEQATNKVDQSSNSGAAMAMIMDGHGIDIDVDDIGLGGIIETASTLDSDGNPSPMSREDMMETMRKQNQKRIDDQVERLAPALTPEQTGQYRKHLESKSSGMFQNMLLEGADPDGPTGVFKIETRIGE